MDISAYAALKGAERPSPLQYIKAQKAEAQKQGLEAYKAITEGQYKQAQTAKVEQETLDLQDTAQLKKRLQEHFKNWVGSGDPKELEQMKQLDLAVQMALAGASSVAQPVAQAAVRGEPSPSDYEGAMEAIAGIEDPEERKALAKRWAESMIAKNYKTGGNSLTKFTPDKMSDSTLDNYFKSTADVDLAWESERRKARTEMSQAVNDAAQRLGQAGIPSNPGSLAAELDSAVRENMDTFIKNGFFGDSWDSMAFTQWKEQWIRSKLQTAPYSGNLNVPEDQQPRNQAPVGIDPSEIVKRGVDNMTGLPVFQLKDGRIVYADGNTVQ